MTSATVAKMNASVPTTTPATVAPILAFLFDVAAGDDVWFPTLVVWVVIEEVVRLGVKVRMEVKMEAGVEMDVEMGVTVEVGATVALGVAVAAYEVVAAEPSTEVRTEIYQAQIWFTYY